MVKPIAYRTCFDCVHYKYCCKAYNICNAERCKDYKEKEEEKKE